MVDGRIVSKAAVIFLTTVGTCWAGCCTTSSEPQCRKEVKPDPVEAILKQLNQKTSELKSYQAKIEYEVNQPLFETRTLRKGVLYYEKYEKGAKLRINFQTLQQDDEKEQNYIDQYVLDGIWLTQIDYQIKAVKRYQLVDPNAVGDANEPVDVNKPVDVFGLVSRIFPIVGFSKAEDLKKEFVIELVVEREKKSAEFVHLHLKVKPDSVYRDRYASIEFWADKKTGLPARMVAVSAGEEIYEREIYQIRLLEPKINKKIDKKVFEIRIPRGFSIGTGEIPLGRADKGKEQRH